MKTEAGIETCAVKGIHQETIDLVSRKMPPAIHLYQLADLFKVLGDGTRIGILWALSQAEMCVCDLCALLKMKQPAVSHQLRNLKQARLVRSRREGKVVYYSLDDHHVARLLGLGMEHVRE